MRLSFSAVAATDVVPSGRVAGLTARQYTLNNATYNVRDFGAKGDGVTDDYGAIFSTYQAAPAGATVYFPPGVYRTSQQLGGNVKDQTYTIGWCADLKPLDGAQFTYVMLVSAKSRVVFEGLRFDVNGTARLAAAALAGGQTTAYFGAGFSACTDSKFIGCSAHDMLGYVGSAVGIVLAGNSTRCSAVDCIATQGGTVARPADGFFTSGDQNRLVGCSATDCFDTGFVVESGNGSGIVGCTALRCVSGGAITNATATDKRGCFIDGLTIIDWNGNGGLFLGIAGPNNGHLLDTSVKGVVMTATTPAYGNGPAVLVARATGAGTGRAKRMSIEVQVNGASTQGILVEGDDIRVNNPAISGVVNGIQFEASCTRCAVNGGEVYGGTFGVYTKGAADVIVKGTTFHAQTSHAGYAQDTSTITAVGCVLRSPANRWGKDAGAALEVLGEVTAKLAPGGITAGAPAGVATNAVEFFDPVTGASKGKAALLV